ncbi:MAG TPA: DUF192 domain-containing protein [bacterium]|nr:DUF192 domain-containing protein [bacterium]
MKNKFFFAGIIFALIFISGCITKKNVPSVVINNQDSTVKNTPQVIINQQSFAVEVASSNQEKSLGLSGRQSLGQNSAMLFVYDNYAVRFFWMQDMNFPLDIIWIKDNSVVACVENVPLLTAGEVTRVTSPTAVNYVLETVSGTCQRYKITAGDFVDIKL